MKQFISAIIVFVTISCNDSQRKPAMVNIKSSEIADTLAGNYISAYVDGNEACSVSILITKKDGIYKYHIKNKGLDTLGLVTITNGYLVLKGLKWKSYTNESEDNEIVHRDLEVEKSKDTLFIQNYGNSMNQYQKLNCESKYIKLVKTAQ